MKRRDKDMTKVLCTYCKKEFLALSDATEAECEFCRRMQKIPKTTAGKARRISAAGSKLDSGRRTPSSTSLDGVIRARLDKAYIPPIQDKIEDRNMMKFKVSDSAKKTKK